MTMNERPDVVSRPKSAMALMVVCVIVAILSSYAAYGVVTDPDEVRRLLPLATPPRLNFGLAAIGIGLVGLGGILMRRKFGPLVFLGSLGFVLAFDFMVENWAHIPVAVGATVVVLGLSWRVRESFR